MTNTIESFSRRRNENDFFQQCLPPDKTIGVPVPHCTPFLCDTLLKQQFNVRLEPGPTSTMEVAQMVNMIGQDYGPSVYWAGKSGKKYTIKRDVADLLALPPSHPASIKFEKGGIPTGDMIPPGIHVHVKACLSTLTLNMVYRVIWQAKVAVAWMPPTGTLA